MNDEPIRGLAQPLTGGTGDYNSLLELIRGAHAPPRAVFGALAEHL